MPLCLAGEPLRALPAVCQPDSRPSPAFIRRPLLLPLLQTLSQHSLPAPDLPHPASLRSQPKAMARWQRFQILEWEGLGLILDPRRSPVLQGVHAAPGVAPLWKTGLGALGAGTWSSPGLFCHPFQAATKGEEIFL